LVRLNWKVESLIGSNPTNESQDILIQPMAALVAIRFQPNGLNGLFHCMLSELAETKLKELYEESSLA
jgi:hypothetical protein